jgi:outer membrane protein
MLLMKKNLIIVLFVGLSLEGFSQFIKQGTIIGGGAFEFRTAKVKDSDSKGSSFSLMPWAGYLIMDNLAVGGLMNFTSSSSESGAPSNLKSKDSDFTIGPVVRYYLDQGVFVHTQAGFGSSKSVFEAGNTKTTTKFGETKFKLGAGYAIRITDTVLFEPVIGYYVETSKNKSSDTKSTVSGLFMMGGFTVFLK